MICPIRLAEVKRQFELINRVTREHEEINVGRPATSMERFRAMRRQNMRRVANMKEARV